MKKIIYSLLLLCVMSSLFSCEQVEVMIFEQRAGVSFTGGRTDSYSFISSGGAKTYTVIIPVVTLGDSANYDRKVEIVVWEGDGKKMNTTSHPDYYEIGEGVIPAGEFQGEIPVTLKYYEALDNKIDTIYFKLRPTNDFPYGGYDDGVFRLTVTNTLIKPKNWYSLATYFGTAYSRSWYSFILGVVGMTYIPYPAANEVDMLPGDHVWTYFEMIANVGKVRAALIQYNIDHPTDPLTHDEGPNIDDPVQMP